MSEGVTASVASESQLESARASNEIVLVGDVCFCCCCCGWWCGCERASLTASKSWTARFVSLLILRIGAKARPEPMIKRNVCSEGGTKLGREIEAWMQCVYES